MRRIVALAALAALSFATALARAQAPSTPVEPRMPGVAPPTAQAADASARATRPHDDADARACLEFLSNIGVIRCAEKYRYGHERPAH
jgi:hypothetical protein